MPSWDMLSSFWVPLFHSYGRYALPALVVLLAIWLVVRMGGRRKEPEPRGVREGPRRREGRDLTETIGIAEAECGALRDVIAVFSKELASPSLDGGGIPPDPDSVWLATWNAYEQTAMRLPDPLGLEVREIVEPLRKNWEFLPPSSRAPELRRAFYRLHEVLEQEEAELKTLKNLLMAQESSRPRPS